VELGRKLSNYFRLWEPMCISHTIAGGMKLQRLQKKTGSVAIQCDQKDKDCILNIVDSTFDKKKRIDILVNNAGITDDQFFCHCRYYTMV